jgi:CBS-domain-containing membrane protein
MAGMGQGFLGQGFLGRSVLVGAVLLGVAALVSALRRPLAMLIRECMTRQTTGVTFETPARHVAKLMDHHDVETIPVVDDDRHLVGCVMARDLWSLLCAPRGVQEDTGIRGITSALPPTVSADDTI